LQLARWRPHVTPAPFNIILCTEDEAQEHLAGVAARAHAKVGDALDADAAFNTEVLRAYGRATVERIEARLRWARQQGFV
jgi:hypothetical protein